MYQDIADLGAFYQSELGQSAAARLAAQIRALWPDLRGQAVMGLGYATPYLEAFRGEAERVLAIMPAAQGILPWPSGGASAAALADPEDLPLADYAIDRVLLVHALEFSENQSEMLREIWRILPGGGRLLVAVPNRRSLWSQLERTPFGFGQPFSAGQLSRLLRGHSFTPLRTAHALFMPPFHWRALIRAAPAWEQLSMRWFHTLSGVILMEAAKQLYGAVPVRASRKRRLALPLPLGKSAPNPAHRG